MLRQIQISARVPFVGFIVGNGEFFSEPSKISAVTNMTAPCSGEACFGYLLFLQGTHP